MNRNVIRQFPFTQIELCPAKSPLSRWVRNDGIARSSGPWATSRAERIRSSLGTWSAWTPFFVPLRYSFSRPLCRKLKIALSLYRVTWRDTTTFTPGSRPRARPASAPPASLRRERSDYRPVSGSGRAGRSIPLDPRSTCVDQGLVRTGERSRRNEGVVSTRASCRVRGRDDPVSLVGDQARLLLGSGAPEGEHDAVRLLVDGTDDGVGEVLPTAGAVRVWSAGTHREHCVEEEDSLACPAFEVPALGWSNLGVAFELLPDLAQRWWELPLRDREGETVRLPLSVVRVLAQDDNAHLGVWGQLERTEHLLSSRIDRPCFALLVDELGELRPTRRVQGIAQDGIPVVGEHS